MRGVIKSVIHFSLGERPYGWPVQATESVRLKAGDEGHWFIATDELDMLSVEARLRKPSSKPGLTFIIEKCHWKQTKSQRLREWLSRWFPSLSPWEAITDVTIDAGRILPVERELPTPTLLSLRDYLRVRVKEVGKEYPGAGLSVMVHVKSTEHMSLVEREK